MCAELRLENNTEWSTPQRADQSASEFMSNTRNGRNLPPSFWNLATIATCVALVEAQIAKGTPLHPTLQLAGAGVQDLFEIRFRLVDLWDTTLRVELSRLEELASRVLGALARIAEGQRIPAQVCPPCLMETPSSSSGLESGSLALRRLEGEKRQQIVG